jgi:hypothetical protein
MYNILLEFYIYSGNRLITQYNNIIIFVQSAIEKHLAMCTVHSTNMTGSTIVSATTTMDMTVKLGITLPKSIIQKIDNMRGDIPRSKYIRRVIERYLAISNKVIKTTAKKKRK